jgi:hypothetical protein
MQRRNIVGLVSEKTHELGYGNVTCVTFVSHVQTFGGDA